MLTIYESFARSARAHGPKPLFERPGLPGIRYDAALELTNRLAGVLLGLGVGPGERVAMQVAKSPEAICLYLATLQVGAVHLPLNTAYTGAEMDYFVQDATPRVLVVAPEALDAHRHRVGAELSIQTLGAHADGSLLDLAAGTEPVVTHVGRGEHDHAATLYTSGTTGRSKGAILTHGNLASNCAALVDAWRFSAADRLIHALPIFHAHGLFVAANMVLTTGATMIFCPGFDPEQVLDLMPDATVLMGVPTFYTRLLASPQLDAAATSAMRLFVAGSAPLLAQDHRAFAQRTGHHILERYGMTETCMITSNPYDGERIPGAVGFPLPGVQVRVTDRESGRPVPDGQVGVVEVSGPNVFAGYWNMPEKTAAEFRDDGYFITGDLGVIGDDGYLRLVGRDKDLVITGGYNVYPKEVEALIDEVPGVLESAVIGLPHPDLGEGVTAIVVRRPGAAVDAQTIQAALRDRLARYKQPKAVLFADELPRNTMGKVQKAALREQYQQVHVAGA